jgi:O-antigen ligase
MTAPALDPSLDGVAQRSAWKGGVLLFGPVAVVLAVLLAMNPPVAIGCAIGIALIALSALRPLYGLAIILTAVSLFGSDSILRLHLGWQWVEVDLILAIAFLGWVARGIARGRIDRIHRLDIALALFAVTVTIGAVKGLGTGTAFEELRSELRPPAYLILVYAIARTSIREAAALRRFLLVLAVGVILSVLKVLVVYSGVPLPAAGSPERLVWATRVMNSGGMKRVIAQGAEIFPLLMTLCLLPLLPGLRSIGKRLLGWSVVSLLLLGVALSMTRSYWLGLAAGLLTLLCVHRVRGAMRLWGEIAGIVVILLCGFFLLQSIIPGFDAGRLTERMEHRALGPVVDGPDPSTRGRLDELDAIQEIVASHPWTGTGLGGTYVFYSALGGGIREWEFTHNSYASWAMKLGLTGLLAMVSVLFLGLLAAVQIVRHAASPADRALASGILASLVALCATSLTAPWLTHYVGAAWAGLTLGGAESIRLTLAQTHGGER